MIRLAKWRQKRPAAGKNKPLIIGGFFRSGTSLFRRLLDAHSRIHCGPEVKFFRDFYGDYLTDPLSHIRFFQTARQLGINEKDLLQRFGKAFIKLHEHAAKIHGKKTWADKNPENVLYLEQWHFLLGGRFTFVHVIRNPLDALASLQEVGFKKTVPESFEEKVDLYSLYLARAEAYLQRNPKNILTLRYEDLVTSPEKTLTAFLEAIGENFEPWMLEAYLDPARRRGIEDPKVNQHKSINTGSIGRWKTDLTEAQCRYAGKKLANTELFCSYFDP